MLSLLFRNSSRRRVGRREARRMRVFLGVPILFIFALFGFINIINHASADTISGYKIYINGEELADGQELDGTETISASFDWEFVNNTEDKNLEVNLGLRGLKAISKEGSLYYKGEEVGAYRTSEDGVLRLTLNDNSKKYSNIVGGAILDVELDVSENRSEKDRTPIEIGIGDTIKTVEYRNPGVVLLNKSSSKLQLDNAMNKYYIDYTLSFSAQEIMDSITIRDDIDPISKLATDSVVIKKDNNIITDTVDIAKTESGFSMTLPAIENKGQKHNYEITYRVLIDVTTDILSKNEIKNNAVLKYVDENNAEKELTKSAVVTNFAPSVDKRALQMFSRNNNTIFSTKYRYNDRSIIVAPVQYTIAIKPNGMEGLFISNPNLSISIADAFNGNEGDIILDNNFMFHSSAGVNGPILHEAYVDNSMDAFYYSLLADSGCKKGDDSSDCYISHANQFYNPQYYYSHNYNLYYNDDQLLAHLKNAAKLFGVTGDDMGETANYDIKISDFVYNSSSKEYEFKYVVLVPVNTYATTVSNTATVELAGKSFSDTESVTIETSPSAMIIKEAIDDNIDKTKNVFSDNTYKQYDKEGTRRSRADYVSAISFKSWQNVYTRVNDSFEKGYYGSAYSPMTLPINYGALSSIEHIKIVDKANYTCEEDGKCNQGFGSSWLRLDDEFKESFTIDIYSDFSKYTPTLGDDYRRVRKEYYDYMDTYGNFRNQKEGFNSDTFLNLYRNTTNALSEYRSSAHYFGSITYDDLMHTPNSYSVNIFNNTISIDFINPQTNLINAAYYDIINPNGDLMRERGVDRLNIFSFVAGDFYFVIRYSVDVNDNMIVNDSTSLKNSLSVYFDDDIDPSDDVAPPKSLNSTIYPAASTDGPENTPPTISKASESLQFKDQTVDFNHNGETIGWSINTNFSNIKAPEAGTSRLITITDNLPDELLPLDYSDSDNLIAYILRYGTESTFNLSDIVLDSSLYNVTVNGKKLEISLNYTSELAEAVRRGWITFYFRTAINETILASQSGNTVSISNGATVTVGSGSNSATGITRVTIPHLIKKEALDRSNVEVTGAPYEENGDIKANYRLEINPSSIRMSDSATVKVRDNKTNVMLVDYDSIRAVDGDTGETIGVNHQVDGNVIEFTIPNQRHILIYYTVKFDIDPTEDVNWMRVENTKNEAKIVLESETSGLSDSINFANYHAAFSIWIRNMTGKIAINKYYQDQNQNKKHIPGTKFELHSVYDNNGHAYSEDDDDIFVRFGEITTDNDGNYEFANLPLDRIYKIVETQSAEGFQKPDKSEFYFVLVGQNGVDVNKYCSDNGIKDCDIKAYHSGDVIEIENNRIENDKIPNDENANNPKTSAFGPAVYFMISGTLIAVFGLVVYKRVHLNNAK